MTISPEAKKNLSAVGFAALGAGLAATLTLVLKQVPAYADVAVIAVFTGLAHKIDAWGHSERVEQAITDAAASTGKPPSVA